MDVLEAFSWTGFRWVLLDVMDFWGFLSRYLLMTISVALLLCVCLLTCMCVCVSAWSVPLLCASPVFALDALVRSCQGRGVK